jgi:membrane-bound serine protease (ClpP class)
MGEEETPSCSETAVLTGTTGTEESAYRKFLEKEGVAKTDLRPAGVVLVDGQRVDVVTEGAMIEVGARVKVVAVEGNRIVVRRVRV